MSRRATPQQVDLLAAVEAGQVTWGSGRQGSYTVLRDGHDKPVTTAAERLLSRGWTHGPNGQQRVVTDRLTPEGERVLADARAWAALDQAPADVVDRVRVQTTTLGASNIAGWNTPRKGRAVYCRLCAEAGHERGVYGAGEVHRINGCTRDDVRYAEELRRDHVLAHVRGEIPGAG